MFSQNLKLLRERDGVSQARFAEEIHFSQSAVSAWENGTREPGITPLVQIAQYFNVTVDYLIGKNTTIPKKENTELTADGKKLLDIFNSLDPICRGQVLVYAEYIKSRPITQKKKN